MNLKELDNFRLAKAISFNTDLNPQLFMGDKMRPLVRNKLLEIADHFREFLGVGDIALVDIAMSGSNAAYSYTPHSDVDLHLIVDFTKLPHNEVYRELFDAKKSLYNDTHNIKIKGYDVELYVQDAAQRHVTLGEYSVLNDNWNRIPTKQRANLDDTATLLKYEKLKELAIRALASDNEKYLNDALSMVKKYRQAGLDKHGEFGPENLAFKMLRTDGYFQKLWAKKREFEDRGLSLETVKNVPDTDLEQELANEFNGIANNTKTEAMIKRLYASRNSLFDDFDYDYVHESASRVAMLAETSYEYGKNIGSVVIVKFFSMATKQQIDLLTRLLKAKKTDEAWQLIQKVTGTNLKGQQIKEGVGKIVKGVNTTDDVGVNQTKIEAAKLGLTVTKDGIPPLLKSNGETKTVENIYESTLLELKMSPGRVAKEVQKVIGDLNPIIGLEFEVCMSHSGGDANPDVGKYTTFSDIKDFFENNSDDELAPIYSSYDEWVMDQQGAWATEKAKEAAWQRPQYDSSKIIEIMQDYTTDGDFDEWLEKTYGDDIITNDIAKEILSIVLKAIERWGDVDDWDEGELETSPALQFYHEVFVEDEDALETLHDYFSDDFWNMDPYSDEDYSFGAWCLKHNIKDMHDVWREWENILYWPGNGFFEENFDEATAEMVVGDLESAGYSAFMTDDVSVESADEWIVKPDSSIAPDNDLDSGLEIAMPPMEYQEGIEAIEWFMDYIDGKGGYTNDSTGLHINVSFSNLPINQVDYVKLALLSGDKQVLKSFGREFNEYTRHSLSLIADAINVKTGPAADREGKAKKHAVVMSRMKNNLGGAAQALVSASAQHSHQSISMKGNRVEFRSAGGNYMNMFDDIMFAINRAVYSLAIASNPDAYKKEYAKKLYKLATNVSDSGDGAALTIFAAYNAGIIDKDRLKEVLKSKQEKKVTAVDTGEPRAEPTEADEKMILNIADHYAISDSEAGMLWMEAEQKEYERLQDLAKAQKVAYNNLMSDIGYYRR